MARPRVPDFNFRLMPLVASVLERKRVPVEPLLLAHGFHPDDARRSELTAPLAQVLALVAAAAKATGDPLFGCTLAAAAPKGTYALVEFAARAAGTLREGLQVVARYGRVINIAEFHYREASGEGHLEHRAGQQAHGLGRDLNVFTVAIFLRMVREGAGADFAPTAVWFAHPQEPEAARLGAALGAKVTAGAGCNGFSVSGPWLDAPLASADPALRAFLEQQVERALEALPRPDDTVARVRSHVAERLRQQAPTLQTCAAALHLSARTLQRRLEEASSSFQEVLDAVRHQLALEYLRQARLNISEVAFLLGYSELRAFDRAFRRWTGQTPNAWRRAQGGRS